MNAKRIAPCGIIMMDSAIDVIPSRAALPRPRPRQHRRRRTSRRSRQALMAIRPYIRKFASGGALEALATGQTCLAFDYSGDVVQAAARAEEAGRASPSATSRRGRAPSSVRHAGGPGRRAAQGRGAGVHQLRAAAGDDGAASPTPRTTRTPSRPAAPDDPPAIAEGPRRLPRPTLRWRASSPSAPVPPGGGAGRAPRMWARFKAGRLSAAAIAAASSGLVMRYGGTVALDGPGPDGAAGRAVRAAGRLGVAARRPCCARIAGLRAPGCRARSCWTARI